MAGLISEYPLARLGRGLARWMMGLDGSVEDDRKSLVVFTAWGADVDGDVYPPRFPEHDADFDSGGYGPGAPPPINPSDAAVLSCDRDGAITLFSLLSFGGGNPNTTVDGGSY